MAWEEIVDQKFNQEFVGHAELCEWTFSVPLPEQLGAQWIANRLIDGHIEELQKEGSQLLELTVWEDTSPIEKTHYYVRVVATASPLYWTAIIVGVLIVLVIAGLSYIITKIENIVEYVGDKAPQALSVLPWLGLGIVAVVGIALVRRR